MSAALPDPSPALVAARAFAARGWRPFPLDHPSLPACAAGHKRRPCDGKRGKHPVGGWGTQTASVPTDGMLRLWFGSQPRNVGIAAGPSGLLVLDEDRQDALAALAEQHGEELPDTYRVLTSRGWHWYFADPGNEFGNGAGALGVHGIDVRGGSGAGGYVVAAGSTHASGIEYMAQDSAADVALLPEWIKVLLRAPGASTVQDQDTRGVPPSGGWTDEPRYGLPDELRAQYERHLAAVRTRGGEFRHELFLAALDGWRLVDIGLGDEHTMLRQIREAILRVWGAEPDDDDRNIVYSEARQRALASPWVALDPLGAASGSSAPDAAELSSWAPLDLGPHLRGEHAAAEPGIGLRRRDGVALLYPGKEHAVIGEMEAGKSWFSLGSAVAELVEGRHVVYIHFEEDDPGDTVARLLLLGATPARIGECFHFVAPSAPVTRDEIDRLVALAPSLVILDGQNEGMALHGLGIREEDGAAAYRRLLVKPFTAVGAAVLSCDHVVKDTDRSARGYALGSIHKGNGLNGALILLENEEPFGMGRRGASRVFVTKDRPGQVRRHGHPTTVPRKFFLGMLAVDATESGAAELMFWPPRPEAVAAPFGLVACWHDVLSDESALPGEVAVLTGKGSDAARDIFRLLRFVDDPDGATSGDLRVALGEADRKHARSTFLAGRALLLAAGICEQGSTPARVALALRFTPSGGGPRSTS